MREWWLLRSFCERLEHIDLDTVRYVATVRSRDWGPAAAAPRSWWRPRCPAPPPPAPRSAASSGRGACTRCAPSPAAPRTGRRTQRCAAGRCCCGACSTSTQWTLQLTETFVWLTRPIAKYYPKEYCLLCRIIMIMLSKYIYLHWHWLSISKIMAQTQWMLKVNKSGSG